MTLLACHEGGTCGIAVGLIALGFLDASASNRFWIWRVIHAHRRRR
jgi:hypothetical protein